MTTRDGKTRLYVIGLGVSVPDHVTREASAALSRCDHVFTIVQEPPALWLPEKAAQTPVTNLLDTYVEGALRTDNYERVSKRIFDALDTHETIAYVTYGNPLVYDSVSQNLVRLAEKDSVAVKIVPGISSIDTLLCDIRLDLAPGIQIYEAYWMVAAEITLNVKTPAILVQLGLFGSLRAHYRERPSASSLEPLAEYLRRFYPGSHTVFLVRSGNKHVEANVRKVSVDNLINVDDPDFLGGSMYIPALVAAKPSPELLSRMAQP